MDYAINMQRAANRHFQAAEALAGHTHRRVAGYLYGIAAECAIKVAMTESGMRPRDIGDRRGDPFYAHFETLKTLLRDTASGRHAAKLRRYSENSSFMQYWDTSMRYSDGTQIQDDWVVAWREGALQALATMNS